MPRKRYRAENRKKSAEINVTAFMNLMVVLVPFLLITAVFTNISIHDLKLPSREDIKAGKDENASFGLNLVIRNDELILADQNGSIMKRIPKAASGHNFQLLNQSLWVVKTRYPELTAIAILMEPKIQYVNMIKAMDAVRQFRTLSEGEIVNVELFPDISIGDAPKQGSGA